MPPWANKEHTMPSSSKLWRALLGLGILGLLVSLYLLWIKFNPADPFCAGVGDCEAVNSSIYSTVRGIPVALFGVLAYAALVASLLVSVPAWRNFDPLMVLGPEDENDRDWAGVMDDQAVQDEMGIAEVFDAGMEVRP